MDIVELLGKENWTQTEGTRDDELYPLLQQIHEQQATLVNRYAGDGLLLDIGSGRNPLPPVANATNHVCLDPDRRLLEEARTKYDEYNYVRGLGDKLPFQSASVSTVFLRNVVHHLDRTQQEHLFDEVHRVLSADGAVVVYEGNENSWYRSFALGVGELVGYTEQSPHADDHGFVDRKRLTELCNYGGFDRELVGTTGSLLEPLAYLYPYDAFVNQIIDLRRHLDVPWWQVLVARKS